MPGGSAAGSALGYRLLTASGVPAATLEALAAAVRKAGSKVMALCGTTTQLAPTPSRVGKVRAGKRG